MADKKAAGEGRWYKERGQILRAGDREYGVSIWVLS